MRKSFFFVMLLLSMGMLQAQEDKNIVAEGDEFILDSPSGSRYLHIDFPRKNVIIKRGAIANFNGLIGEKLTVEAFMTAKDGTTEAVLKRKNGLNFFRFYPTVTANIENALAEGELQTAKKKMLDSLAK